QRTTRGIRQVLLLDRLRDRVGIAGEPRVFGADVALELGELTYELRGLIGLGQPSRLERRLSSTEAFHQLCHPLRLFRERAGAGEERDRGEPLGKSIDPGCNVALKGERRVLEPSLEALGVPGR